jgi:uncharacterized protein
MFVGQAASMGKQATPDPSLENDTVLNVAGLLREQVGASRSFRLRLDRFVLDDDLVARRLNGTLRLTRLSDAVLAHVDAQATVALECQRCLREFEDAYDVEFDEQFRVAYDVKLGTSIDTEADDERFTISEGHELDIGEPLRQEIIVAMPMRPTCGEDCPGPPVLESSDDEPELDDETDGDVDERLASLAKLLAEQDGSTERH